VHYPVRRADSMKPIQSILVTIALLIPLCVYSQAPTDYQRPLSANALLSVVQDEFDRARRDIPIWKAELVYMLLISATIALMGATVAALQAWKHAISKVIVGSIGILITTLTFVETQVFEYDYRTYHDRVAKAENLEYDINRDLNMLKVQLSDKFPMNISENDFINKELVRIRGKVVQINELGKGLKHLPFFLIPSVHAIHASRPDDLYLLEQGLILHYRMLNEKQ
jgi:hypothetical protein